MGSSVSFLYRVISTVEIISSGIIALFGVNTFFLFNQMDDEFQKEKEMIYYSSIVAVAQSILAILASIILIGCYISSTQAPSGAQDETPSQKRIAQIGQQNSLKRKAIAPTWIAWTLISLASLLFVFISPIHYCIQSKAEMETFDQHDHYDSVDNKRIGICHSEAPEVIPIRNSMRDLLSFSFMGIMFKTLFVLLVYRKWRKELRRGKKIMIYVQGCESSNHEQDQGYDPTSTPTPPMDKKMAASPSPGGSSGGPTNATVSGINENGGGGDTERVSVK